MRETLWRAVWDSKKKFAVKWFCIYYITIEIRINRTSFKILKTWKLIKLLNALSKRKFIKILKKKNYSFCDTGSLAHLLSAQQKINLAQRMVWPLTGFWERTSEPLECPAWWKCLCLPKGLGPCQMLYASSVIYSGALGHVVSPWGSGDQDRSLLFPLSLTLDFICFSF